METIWSCGSGRSRKKGGKVLEWLVINVYNLNIYFVKIPFKTYKNAHYVGYNDKNVHFRHKMNYVDNYVEMVVFSMKSTVSGCGYKRWHKKIVISEEV